eukprot:10470771-Alexandrium_andersonii.AAC.1
MEDTQGLGGPGPPQRGGLFGHLRLLGLVKVSGQGPWFLGQGQAFSRSLVKVVVFRVQGQRTQSQGPTQHGQGRQGHLSML